MKAKLILLLKTLFASKGFNAKELEGLADLVIAQNTLTDESTDQDLQTAADAAKPTADFVQSVASRQVTDVKKPKPVDEPEKPVDPAKPVDPTKPAEDMPEWAKALVASTQALAQGLQSIQADKVGASRREQFIKSMEGTSPEYQAKELKKFDRIPFKDDEDFAAFLEDTKDDHVGAIQDAANEGLGNDRPAGGLGKKITGEKEVSPAMKELIAEREAKAKLTAQTV